MTEKRKTSDTETETETETETDRRFAGPERRASTRLLTYSEQTQLEHRILTGVRRLLRWFLLGIGIGAVTFVMALAITTHWLSTRAIEIRTQQAEQKAMITGLAQEVQMQQDTFAKKEDLRDVAKSLRELVDRVRMDSAMLELVRRAQERLDSTIQVVSTVAHGNAQRLTEEREARDNLIKSMKELSEDLKRQPPR